MTSTAPSRSLQGIAHIPVVIAGTVGVNVPLLLALVPGAARTIPLLRRRGWNALCDDLVSDPGASASTRAGQCDLEIDGEIALRGELCAPPPIGWSEAVEFAGRKAVYVVAPPFVAGETAGVVTVSELTSWAGSRLTAQALIAVHATGRAGGQSPAMPADRTTK